MRPDSPFLDPAFADPAHSMKLLAKPGDRVVAGQVIATGRVRQGDHIFVNKVRYHFTRPKRGQIIVFDTNYIPQKERLGIRPDTFYIKRLVGLPGEAISIGVSASAAGGRAGAPASRLSRTAQFLR